MTIKEATEKWVDGFNAIPLIEVKGLRNCRKENE